MKKAIASTISLGQEIIDTLLIIACYVMSAFVWGAWPFRILISVCYVMALTEIYAAVRNDPPKQLSDLRATILAVIILSAALILTLTYRIETGNYLFWISIVTASDAFGLFFGRIFGNEKPSFSRKISPNKTWAGYIGEMVGSFLVGTAIAACFQFRATPDTMIFLFFGFIACAIGDLIGSAAKRELKIKHSGECLSNKRFFGAVETIARSRHGFLDWFDSASLSFIFYVILIAGRP